MKRIIIIAAMGCFMTSAILADTGPPNYREVSLKEMAALEIHNLETLMVKDHYSFEQILQDEANFKLSCEQEAERAQVITHIAIVPQTELFTKVVTNGYVTKIPYNICERDNGQKITITLKNNYPASGGISFRS